MSVVTVYVPGDAGALAVGADAVARAIAAQAQAHKVNIKLVRNGSRGMYWLERSDSDSFPRACAYRARVAVKVRAVSGSQSAEGVSVSTGCGWRKTSAQTNKWSVAVSVSADAAMVCRLGRPSNA